MNVFYEQMSAPRIWCDKDSARITTHTPHAQWTENDVVTRPITLCPITLSLATLTHV